MTDQDKRKSLSAAQTDLTRLEHEYEAILKQLDNTLMFVNDLDRYNWLLQRKSELAPLVCAARVLVEIARIEQISGELQQARENFETAKEAGDKVVIKAAKIRLGYIENALAITKQGLADLMLQIKPKRKRTTK